ncbi:uncharacterized protein LOC143285381 [Babylonia areolata]|uniref:uncharacterized protein LOC143285381 n=1 Tax=Babylonia areolata TaxID=304850 RepID=UPI003FD20801
MEVQTCVASPSSSMMAMHNDSSEELIRNSCPAKEDVEVIDSEQHSSDGSGKQNASGPHHHFRFSFKPNVLSGSSSDSSSSGKASSSSMGLVYIHCRVRLCSAPSCPRPSSECAPLRPSRSEGGGNRVKRAVTEPLGGNEWESTGHHLSTGPLFVTVFDTTDAPRSTEAPLYSPLVIVLGSLAGLATIVAIGVIVAWMLTHKGQGRDEVTAS